MAAPPAPPPPPPPADEAGPLRPEYPSRHRKPIARAERPPRRRRPAANASSRRGPLPAIIRFRRVRIRNRAAPACDHDELLIRALRLLCRLFLEHSTLRPSALDTRRFTSPHRQAAAGAVARVTLTCADATALARHRRRRHGGLLSRARPARPKRPDQHPRRRGPRRRDRRCAGLAAAERHRSLGRRTDPQVRSAAGDRHDRKHGRRDQLSEIGAAHYPRRPAAKPSRPRHPARPRRLKEGRLTSPHLSSSPA